MFLFKKTEHRNYYALLTGAFVGILIISEVTAVKIVQLGPFTVPGAVIIFPLSYILGDVLTEVYGYARARHVIWTGFLMTMVMVVCFEIVRKLPAAAFWNNQDAWDAILGLTPRIVIASLIAYAVGEFSNSYVLAKMKIKTQGRYLWMRTIGSTIVGEGLDTIIFITVAFAGTTGMDTSALLGIIISQYLIKVGVEIIMTPVTYAIVGFLKREEKVDTYDTATNFNPFQLT